MKLFRGVKTAFVCAIIMNSVATVSFADDDREGFSIMSRFTGVAPVKSVIYRTACAECHFAYQPGLLPQRSWNLLMSKRSLEDHFGEDVNLIRKMRSKIRDYLVDNAADISIYKKSQKIDNSIRKSEAPIRVSATPYFLREHEELTSSMVRFNKGVTSISNCLACHKYGEEGSFEEDDVIIPNYGYWSLIDDD